MSIARALLILLIVYTVKRDQKHKEELLLQPLRDEPSQQRDSPFLAGGIALSPPRLDDRLALARAFADRALCAEIALPYPPHRLFVAALLHATHTAIPGLALMQLIRHPDIAPDLGGLVMLTPDLDGCYGLNDEGGDENGCDAVSGAREAQQVPEWHPFTFQLSYWVAGGLRGQGIGTRAVQAFLAETVPELRAASAADAASAGRVSVVALIEPHNLASQLVAERCGLRYGTTLHTTHSGDRPRTLQFWQCHFY